MADDLTDVIHTLEERRAEHVRQTGLLDQAIDSLRALAGTGPAAAAEQVSAPPSATAPQRPATALQRSAPSVSQAVIDLAAEEDRQWSPEEMLTEFKARDIPFDVADLQNSVFSALSRAHRKGALVRPTPGRYRSAKFAPEAEEPAPQEWSSEVPESWLPGIQEAEAAVR